MQRNNLKNIFFNMLSWNKCLIILNKIYIKFFDKKSQFTKDENMKWIKNHTISYEKFAKDLSEDLWSESLIVSEKIKKESAKKLEKIDITLGGGGIYPLLYFISRYIKPESILETGVAAGFSSFSFLEAIKDNKKGRLYSSDFPYFRLDNPEKYIGIVVPDKLKDKWDLLIEGDTVNVPEFNKKIKKFDLIHYDSDKSYSGRLNFIKMIKLNTDKDTIILMDDIQDNSFFHDYINKNKIENCKIFEFDGKYIGMIGELK